MLTHIHPSPRRFTCRTMPIFHGHGDPGSESGAGRGPPGAQSPFARTRCYLARRSVSNPLRGRYPSFIAHTSSCARPKPSCRLRSPLLRHVCAGYRQSLLGDGPSRRYLRESVSARLDLYPGASPGAFTRFFPGDIGLPCLGIGSASHNDPYSGFCTGAHFVAIDHSRCSGLRMCSPPRSLLPQCGHWAAVVCTSEPMTVCYLPPSFPVRAVPRPWRPENP
jgi:hypothetical protein